MKLRGPLLRFSASPLLRFSASPLLHFSTSPLLRTAAWPFRRFDPRHARTAPAPSPTRRCPASPVPAFRRPPPPPPHCRPNTRSVANAAVFRPIRRVQAPFFTRRAL
ncbi:hypothetical protein CFB41_15560 [Burkholderia sp. AU33803]|nr:hypothetical protein CFB41_15560 [Burkholderia sp. AU33803]